MPRTIASSSSTSSRRRPRDRRAPATRNTPARRRALRLKRSQTRSPVFRRSRRIAYALWTLSAAETRRLGAGQPCARAGCTPACARSMALSGSVHESVQSSTIRATASPKRAGCPRAARGRPGPRPHRGAARRSLRPRCRRRRARSTRRPSGGRCTGRRALARLRRVGLVRVPERLVEALRVSLAWSLRSPE